MKILAIGEIMLEMSHIEGNSYIKKFAGDTFNVLYYAKKITPSNWSLSYFTSVGNDSISLELIDFIEKNGIQTKSIVIHKERTLGLFILSNLPNGEKQYLYWRGQSAAKTLFDSSCDLSHFDVIYFSGITAAIMQNKENLINSVKNTNATLIYDFNHRKQLWTEKEAVDFTQKFLPFCSFIKISDEEFHFLFPNLAFEDFSSNYPDAEIIYTCGEKGAQTWRNGKKIIEIPSKKVDKIVDTSGAGDSFLGVYMICRLRSEPEKLALQKANELAAHVVQEKGSLISIDRNELSF